MLLRGVHGGGAAAEVTTDMVRAGAGTLPASEQLPGVLLRESYYSRVGKPFIDRVLGTVLLLALLPVLALLSLAVLSSVGAPVIFRQRRVGLGGAPFEVYKFRTMTPDRRHGAAAGYVGPERRLRHKTPDDPRVTRLGGLLRRLSLDELPQLWNVVRGDMSLVGPRPEVVELVERHYEPWQLARHQVRPGITGLWQVSSRASGLIYENVHLDLEYIARMSLWTDCKILLRTAKAVTGKAGGY